MLMYLCATSTERILDNSALKATMEKPCSQIKFLAEWLPIYYGIPVEWIQGFIQGVGGPVLMLADSVGDRQCSAWGGVYLEGVKQVSSRKLD